MAPKARKLIMKKKGSCSFCGQVFKFRSQLSNHLKTCRKARRRVEKAETFRCDECNKRFIFKQSFKAHLRNEHSKLPGSVACSQCFVRCPNAKTLKEHIQNKHERTIYSCDKCGKEFVRHAHVLRHKAQKGCDGKKHPLYPCETFRCDECNKRFIFKQSFKAHLRNEHSKLPGSVACSQCFVRCPNAKTLKEHIQNKHERTIYSCDKCGKEFVRHAHVLRHKAQKGCDGKKHPLYPCEICKATFSRKDNLMVHLRMQHITKKEFECKLCDYGSKSFSKLIVHFQNYHLERPYFECDHCGKATSSRASMAKHLEIHGEKKYACEVCAYSTFTLEVMRRHVLTHVKEKPYKCSLCPRSFIQRSQLQKHLHKHQDQSCPICGAVFSSKYKLTIHKKEHNTVENGNDLFYCPYQDCRYATEGFSDVHEVKKHINEHTEKSFKCEVCEKRYASEGLVRRHVLTHTLERPRRCMYCVSPRAYVRGLQLVKHVRRSHASVFHDHLVHVRSVLGLTTRTERVKTGELQLILNVLDAEADRILQGYGEGVLYGGMQDTPDTPPPAQDEGNDLKYECKPLVAEEVLAANLHELLSRLIDKDTLECFGWPKEPVDTVLEKVIEQCGGRAAERGRWSRMQRLRENAKQLFVCAVDDKNVTAMLNTHSIDQVVKYVLDNVTEDD